MNQKAGLWSLFSFSLAKAANVLFFLTVVLFGLFVFFTYSLVVLQERNARYVEHSGELRVLSQQIAKNALEAASGSDQAFSDLRSAESEFKMRWGYIYQGNFNPSDGSRPLPASPLDGLDALDAKWQETFGFIAIILQARDTVLSLHEVAKTLSETVPQLQVEYDDVVEILVKANESAKQVAVAQRQSWLAERVIRSADKVLEGGEDAVSAVDMFDRDVNLFGHVLQGMLEGNPSLNITQVQDENALEALTEISELFAFVSGSVDEILKTSSELFHVRNAANRIFADSKDVLEKTTDLVRRHSMLVEGRRILEYLSLGAAGLATVLLVLGSFLRYAESQRNLRETAARNEQNQMAILRLLDELADLADGDLTTQATVTEDFTGAIADSINFAIDQMRTLVSAINEIAVQVSAAAQETQATAIHLAEAAKHQAHEIAGASAAINQMAVSIDQVSSNAGESASVAERSVTIANKSAIVVQNTINGMDNIRGQIQETSKRIKRLGESSQEIGDIVGLIDDIAEQTNILSLNAAIQASMAGDAGRGFAVVADEVQRLAERSSAATKQIEALVKTIQNDTNEAVISMEHTTAEVVRGAHLAQNAGVALEEIEVVSKSLAELIQNISNAARQQASSAGHISNTMNVVQEITSQTSAGTTATTKSISNLADMANKLRESVAGFKLPDRRAQR